MCSFSRLEGFFSGYLTTAYFFKVPQIAHDMFLLTLNRLILKALYQAPVVGLPFPSSQKSQHVFFNSSAHRHCSHQNQLVASKVCFMYNKKHKKLMAMLSSLFGISSLGCPSLTFIISSLNRCGSSARILPQGH